MRFSCRVSQSDAGVWTLSYEGADLGRASVTAPTREQALEKMQRELRYRLEMCPCTGEIYKDVEIELLEQ